LGDQQREALPEAASPPGAESDRESQSGDSGDNETTFDNSRHMKVVVLAALARISYNFGQSNITKTRIGSMESYACYFPKGYGRAPGTEFVPEHRANEAVIFKDFFVVGLHMPPHPVLVDILHKFPV
jgi:hypothetical protein